MRKKEIVAMLLAGGQGSRLGQLTRNIAKPAISFGGKYRIIDFSLSNCVNSNIDTVGVLTQYKPLLLNSYIGNGTAWDLDNADGGAHILPPFLEEDGGSWYKGTANAIYQNKDFIDNYEPEYVLIISGDHIYKMDYSLMLDYHKANKADVTISVLPVPWGEASRFGIITADEKGRIQRFTEKPSEPDSNLASMGIYIFNWSILKAAVLEDEADKNSQHDFGKNVIPGLLAQGKNMFAYHFNGYWRDVGTIESYYEANMDLLGAKPQLNLFESNLRILAHTGILPPHYLGQKADITNSLISNGCIIHGQVINSILSPGVYVGKGTRVENSIIMPQAQILDGSLVSNAIIGERTIINAQRQVGLNSDQDKEPIKITVIADNLASN